MGEPTVSRPSWRRHLRALPDGRTLALPAWQRRHRIVIGILLAHVPALWAFGVYGGEAVGARWTPHDPVHVTFAVAVLAVLTAIAAWPAFTRRLRATLASFALVSASALLTYFSGGFIEAQFHFFVVLALIAFYQDWVPLMLGIVYVAVHHGVVGTLWPAIVYNHEAGMAAPWAWAFIHAAFLLALAVVLVTLTQMQLRAEAQRETATEGMRRERERLRLVLENTGSLIFVVDQGGTNTMVTGADVSGRGGRPDALVGRPVEELFGPEAPEIAANTRRALAGESLAADVPFGERILHTTYRPKWDPATGRVNGALGCVVDVTERVRTEKAERHALLQQAKLGHLRSAERFRRRLFNTAAHELNTPLTPIQIQLEVLLSGELGELNDAQARALDVLERNMKRVGALAKDILDVARIQNARLELFTAPVDISGLVAEAVDSFHATAKVRGVRLAEETEPRLIAQADSGRLTQVLNNLLSNALKFTPEGGTVRVRAERTDGEVRVTVTDSGRGLTEEEIGQLFVAFGQLETEQQRVRQGSGLGLYICRGIVERHGGRIWAQSPGPGEGSTFAFELPLVPQSQREEAATREGPQRGPGEATADAAPKAETEGAGRGLVRVVDARSEAKQGNGAAKARIVPKR